jgi:hypothetical protein
VKVIERTCFSESMEAKPPLWEFSPPFLAAALTSSLERLAKFPGLSLPDMMVGVCDMNKMVVNWE